jgi:hypothetical protein
VFAKALNGHRNLLAECLPLGAKRLSGLPP